MRTTLTLDPDVAARLKRLSRGGRFRDVVNQALRRGLERMEAKEPASEYRVKAVNVGPKRTDLDNTWEVIAEIEGDNYK